MSVSQSASHTVTKMEFELTKIVLVLLQTWNLVPRLNSQNQDKSKLNTYAQLQLVLVNPQR